MKIKSLFLLLNLSLINSVTHAAEEDAREIDVKPLTINQLENLSSGDFEYKELTLTNLTSKKFTPIKSKLEEALGITVGEKTTNISPHHYIRHLKYSIDPTVEKLQRRVDEFMCNIIQTRKVKVEREGTPDAEEQAPLLTTVYPAEE